MYAFGRGSTVVIMPPGNWWASSSASCEIRVVQHVNFSIPHSHRDTQKTPYSPLVVGIFPSSLLFFESPLPLGCCILIRSFSRLQSFVSLLQPYLTIPSHPVANVGQWPVEKSKYIYYGTGIMYYAHIIMYTCCMESSETSAIIRRVVFFILLWYWLTRLATCNVVSCCVSTLFCTLSVTLHTCS